jgi:hypothetical protein
MRAAWLKRGVGEADEDDDDDEDRKKPDPPSSPRR